MFDSYVGNPTQLGLALVDSCDVAMLRIVKRQPNNQWKSSAISTLNKLQWDKLLSNAIFALLLQNHDWACGNDDMDYERNPFPGEVQRSTLICQISSPSFSKHKR